LAGARAAASVNHPNVCALYEVGEHEEARRLDPHVPTSLAYTLHLAGDFERLAREGDTVLDLEPKALALLAQGLWTRRPPSIPIPRPST
jgi:hypothetical protein